jgi:glycine betaine/proline transport system permease protein
VLIPAARPTLMVGVNQVIMLALNMVIISSMIGAGGLGYDVLVALRRLSVGQAMEAGLAIVVLAIVLDRLSQAAAHRTARAHLTDSDASRRMLVYAAVAFLVLISSAIWPGWINVIGVLVGLGVLAALDLALGQLRTALASGATARLPARQGVDVAGSPAWRRYGPLLLALAILAAATLVGLLHRGFTDVPAAITITSGPLWKAAVDWITINFFDAIEAFRVTLIVWFLNPIRAFCEGFPWLGAVGLIGLAGWQLGGWRLALLVAGLTAFCAVTGLWQKTMATVYLCGVAVLVSALLGIPIGLWCARSNRVRSFVVPLIDTLQTIPSFCFIIPVVMLFRVGDVTALIATVAFAIVPAIRYTDHGIRQVPPALLEAAVVSGCTPRQTFWRVQLPLALPEIMLGINQTILMALAMIIICAMIGTRDLGQEVFIALAKADAGRGIVAGLAIAFIGIVADRLLRASAHRLQARLGLDTGGRT